VQARTRAVLAALGIPVWHQRGRAVQRVPVVGVWRGSTEQAVEDASVTPPVQAQSTHLDAPISVLGHGLSIDQVSARPSTLNTRQAQLESLAKMRMGLAQSDGAKRDDVGSSSAQSNDAKPLPVTIDARLDASIARPQDQIAAVFDSAFASQAVDTTRSMPLRFALQARVVGRWVLLVPEDSLQDPAAQRLWDNIGLAMQAKTIERFVWPLAEGMRWQHMDGAAAAVSGFLFRLGASYRVGLMGSLADAACPDRIERLPALAELLREPLQKRGFWQLLRADQSG